MAKKVCSLVGAAFLLVGVAGFALPGLLGTHLSLVHNLIHLASGALSLMLGRRGTEAGARTFCRVVGAVYLLLGVVGYVLGTGVDRVFTVLPGRLELGTMDHAVHVLLGLVLLVGGLLSKPVVTGAPSAA